MAGCVRCDFATCAVGAAPCFLLLPSERVARARMGAESQRSYSHPQSRPRGGARARPFPRGRGGPTCRCARGGGEARWLLPIRAPLGSQRESLDAVGQVKRAWRPRMFRSVHHLQSSSSAPWPGHSTAARQVRARRLRDCNSLTPPTSTDSATRGLCMPLTTSASPSLSKPNGSWSAKPCMGLRIVSVPKSAANPCSVSSARAFAPFRSLPCWGSLDVVDSQRQRRGAGSSSFPAGWPWSTW